MQYPNPQKLSMFKFVIEFLEILNIHENEIIMASENTLYKDVYISTSYTHDIDSNLPPRKEIFDFFKNMVVNVKKNHSLNNTPKKIYVSRRSWLHNDFSNIGTNYTTRRKCMNEDQLVDKLLKNGYTEVFTEKLSTIEKILYFSNATNVVGAIGGGISNVLFSPKTTKLNAIVSPTFLDVNKRFKFCLDNVDVNYDFNTIHYEKKQIKKYMRVKTKDGSITGEIQEIDDDNIIVFINNNETGWDLQNNYEQKKLRINDVINIDDGLNSCWIYKLDCDNKYLL
jgi:capsular polysaccharide biosynthesis protein